MKRGECMSVYVLPYNSKNQLSAHINASELRCKCYGTHNITVNTELIDKIEKLISEIAKIYNVPINKVVINISSANRCKKHDINVGGSGWGMHCVGKALDFQIVCNGVIIKSKLIACIAQEIGFTGIGRIKSVGEYIHCDVGTLAEHGGKKWLGDETIAGGTNGSIINEPQTYWNYYGIDRSKYYKNEKEQSLEEQLQTELNKKGEKLNIDGIIGEKSLEALKKHNIKSGETGEFVKVIQKILNDKGYNCGNPDGFFGEKTLQAICNAAWDKLFG